MKLSLLLDATTIVNRPTGAGVYATQLLKELAPLTEDVGLHIVVQDELSEGHEVNQLKDLANVKFHRVRAGAAGPMKQLGFSRWYLRSGLDVDLVHSLNWEAPIAIRAPLITTIQDVKYLKFPDFFDRPRHLKALYMKGLMKWGGLRSSRIIVPSESTKEDLTRIVGVPSEKIRVIHLGAAFPDRAGTDGPIADDGADSKTYVLCVAENRPHKNLLGTITAFAEALGVDGLCDAQLYIVGDMHGGQRALESHALNLGVRDRIRFLGVVSDEALGDLYHRASAFILLSLYEGFGLPALEAMGRKTPVVVSNRSSLPEVVGDAGWCVDPENTSQVADALREALVETTTRETMIRDGLQRAGQFSWARTARATVDVYGELVDL